MSRKLEVYHIVIPAVYSSMARQIRQNTKDWDNVVLICLLKGGFYLFSKLMVHFSWKLSDGTESKSGGSRIGFMALRSYHMEKQSSDVEVTYHLDLDPEDITGREVWIIDDILDSTKTISIATSMVLKHGPKSVKWAVLVDKVLLGQNNRPTPSVCGIVIQEDVFLVGCGMGLDEQYRNTDILYKVVENVDDTSTGSTTPIRSREGSSTVCPVPQE